MARGHSELLDLSLIIEILLFLFIVCFLVNLLSQYSSVLKKSFSPEITRFLTVLSGSIFIGFMIYAIVVQYIVSGL